MNTRAVLAIDLLISVFSTVLSVSLTSLFFSGCLSRLVPSIEWFTLSFMSSILVFWSLRTYRIIIRHSTLREIGRLVLSSFGKFIILLFLSFFLSPVSGGLVPVSLLLLLDFLFTSVFLTLVRVFMVVLYDIVVSRFQRLRRRESSLIYGIDNKASSLVRTMQLNERYSIEGFIVYGLSDGIRIIQEKRVFGFTSESDFQSLVRSHGISSVIFAHREDARTEEGRLIRYCNSIGVKVLYSPSVEEVVDGRVSRPSVRGIRIEDLLGRPEIQISMDEIRLGFSGRTVMVTGAAGSIGSELCRQLSTFGVRRLVLYDNAETPMHNLRLELEERCPGLSFIPVIGDVRTLPRLDYAFRTYRPDVVFHAAAYKHVPLMEENPCEAVYTNVVGSRNVADKCLEYGVGKMVMISTDKAVNPTNIMGCTKRLAEIYVQSLGLAVEHGSVSGVTRFVTTRFGNVLGSNGSVIPRFRDQISNGGPVTVTHPDITRFFMTIPEACRLVMEAATMTTGNEIFVFDMGRSVRISELAERMIELAGLIPGRDIKIEYTGLRPGEKLYEEVLSDSENTLPTAHDRIRIAKVRDYDYAVARSVVDELGRLSRAVEIPGMVRLMKRTVPEFRSKNSRFDEFDGEGED